MPLPSTCLHHHLRQFTEAFRSCFSQPQFRHFVTVLLGLLQCQEPHTLTGILRQVAEAPSTASLSRFLAQAPWSAEGLVQHWLARFREQMRPLVEAEQLGQQAARPKRRGRPTVPKVTGYLIGDDTTIAKPKGRKMAGLGRHYSTMAGKQVTGHSLVQGLYLLLKRRCPLAPRLYRQRTVCRRASVPFQSKIDLMEDLIRTFEPVPGTLTHVLLDSWYSSKRLWKAARGQDFLITTGLKKNRALRLEDPRVPHSWRWERLDVYLAGLNASDYQHVPWPSQAEEPRLVYVHVISTRVRTLYRCQVVMVRESLTAPLAEARYWASSDLEADLLTLLQHLATRWAVEVLFADTKELLGLDQYQLMSAPAIVRFWTLVLAAYLFLDEERSQRPQSELDTLTIGQTRRAVQQNHQRAFIDWMYGQFQAGVSATEVCQRLIA